MLPNLSWNTFKTGPLALFFIVSIVIATLSISGCSSSDGEKKLSGSTMGTTYHISMINPSSEINLLDLQQDVDMELAGLNQIFSTYDNNSELSQLNQSAINQWHPVSDELFEVLEMALAVGDRTEGAYDITVGPLVNLWGFGPGQHSGEGHPPVTIPTDDQIKQAMQQVCYSCIELDTQKKQVRKQRQLEIDLSSIAKGYAVDRVSDLLFHRQIYNYMVEIGGEVRVMGKNSRGEDWHLGIESPHTLGVMPGTASRALQQRIAVSGVSVATSGDYRNFILHEGMRYSHIIDPRTGYPVSQSPASVTVIAESCALADAWATAYTVIGSEQGLSMANTDKMAAYFVSRNQAGMDVTASNTFGAYLIDDRE